MRPLPRSYSHGTFVVLFRVGVSWPRLGVATKWPKFRLILSSSIASFCPEPRMKMEVFPMAAKTIVFGVVFFLPCLATLHQLDFPSVSSDPSAGVTSFLLAGVHCQVGDVQDRPKAPAAPSRSLPMLSPALLQPLELPRPSPRIPEFRLKDSAGRAVCLADFKDKKAIAVVFIGTECPLVNHYVLHLAELQRELGSKGLQILAINSNHQDTADKIARHAQARKLPFPVLVDPGQKVADRFKAKRTPEVFLLDGERVVRYHGRVDDQYAVGSDRREPLRHDLKEAIIDLLAGSPVRVAKTPVAGCIIGRAPKSPPAPTVTYSRDVAPILQKHCQECHRPDQVAPFSLLTYSQASDWSDTIAEVVQAGRMPPWNADPRHGEFANDARLPDRDRDLLLAWIKQGCPPGDDKDLPPARKFQDGWRIPAPDLVLTMREKFTIPAKPPVKGIEYQYFVLPTNFEEDTWIQAVEARQSRGRPSHARLHRRKACRRATRIRRSRCPRRLCSGSQAGDFSRGAGQAHPERRQGRS
ncbi:MAG: redoxin domain-containing protein [Planctomycetes bacterium]|nr:redoxin domain-containing protein [Planctomycetota bacterium]